ncbi:MAG: HEPN domain-containing protein [Promethearchaeota archaeon]|nr:MAG: HEPN domain-containing protein [Candidatus Lokiarchaeota archaeon]
MAHNNIERVINYYQQGDYAATVFRIQLSVEQLQKAVLLFLGIQFRKTHEPSRIIDAIIYDSDFELEEELLEILKKMSFFAKKIEKEQTATRYGIKKNGMIIPPEDFYDKSKTIEFIDVLIEIISIIIFIFIDVPDLKQESNRLKQNMKKIEDLVKNE